MTFRWSYTSLGDFEKCPAMYKYKHVERLPEVKGPALERGIKIHETVEHYLKGKLAALPPAYDRFKSYIDDVKAKPGLIVEDFWALNRAWQNTTARAADAWWRGKADAYWREGVCGTFVDWKTGKIYGSNRDQMKLYAAVAMSRDPELEKVVVDLVYFDMRESRTEEYTRDELPKLVKHYTDRAGKVETETAFRPRPGDACKWCSYSKSKGGPCSAG